MERTTADKVAVSEYPTPAGDKATLDRIFEAQQAAFCGNPVPGGAERIRHLRRLKQVLIRHQERIVSAINADFGCRSRDETLLAEIFPSVEGIRYAEKRVKKWMKPSRRRAGILFQPAKARVIYQPMGVVGIIVPWNYPLYLGVGPLIGDRLRQAVQCRANLCGAGLCPVPAPSNRCFCGGFPRMCGRDVPQYGRKFSVLRHCQFAGIQPIERASR